ncbi:LrgB-like family-domain-containing protein [Cunninghamella echinulata]|nr:LrgB-like family-domain-containing protein [Cunninghamella echinulata]
MHKSQSLLFITKKIFVKCFNEILKVWIKNFIYFIIVLLYTEAVRQVLLCIPGLQYFPPSVIGMILFCLFLVIIEKWCPPHYINRILSLFQSQAEFALKYMNIMFVPSTLNIINSNQINGIEFIKIAALFAAAYVLIFLLCIGSVKFLRFILYFNKNNNNNDHDINNNNDNHLNQEHHLTPTNTNHSIPFHIQPTIPVLSSSSSSSSISDEIEYQNTHVNKEQQRKVTSSRSSHSSITIHNITKNSIHDDNIDERMIITIDNKDKEKQEVEEIDKEIEESEELDINGWLRNTWNHCQPTIDTVIFFIIFIISTLIYIGLPSDHALLPSTALVSQLTLTILVFLAASHTPLKIKLILHPLISTTAIMLACLGYLRWIKLNHSVDGGGIMGTTDQLFKSAVRTYYTNSHNFFTWIEGTSVDGFAGAGDVLSSAMNVAIVSLALTVFLNKPGDIRQWIILFVTAIPMVLISLLVVPLIAHLILIPSEIALAMTTRTVTTAIGIAISQIIHSNVGIVTCFQSFSAISGPLIGTRLLKLTRVKQDDYLTIGISMGFNSHALATAYLYETNRKASSISSLAFMLFGTLAVIFTSIPQISNTIMSNAGSI